MRKLESEQGSQRLGFKLQRHQTFWNLNLLNMRKTLHLGD